MIRFAKEIAVAVVATAALGSVTLAVAGDHGDKGMATPDIVDTAVAAGSFTTLAAALEAADLIDTLIYGKNGTKVLSKTPLELIAVG